MKKSTLILLSAFLGVAGAAFAQEPVENKVDISAVEVVIEENISADAAEALETDSAEIGGDCGAEPDGLAGEQNIVPAENAESETERELSEVEQAAIQQANAGDAIDQSQTPAALDKPRIAVYVTGGKDAAESRALATYILEALVRSNRYVAIERSDLFLAEIDNEHMRQRSGAIDDAQISRLGKQSGVGFVCVADITQLLRGSQISARVLDVETAEVSAVGVVEARLVSIDDLRRASAEVVGVMLGIVPSREKSLRFTGRFAYNNSYVSKYAAKSYNFDYEYSTLRSKDVWNSMGAGSGVEFGVSTVIGIIGGIAAEAGVSYAWRRPVSVKRYDITESAILIPALLRVNVSKSYPLYAQGGVQLEVPFGVSKSLKDALPVSRESVDAGVVIGVGWQITGYMAFDLRAVHGINSYDGELDHTLYQVTAGVSYVY